MSSTKENPSGFAPNNINDGRDKGNWQTRYTPEALKAINFEAIYLGVLFVITVFLIIAVICELFHFDRLCINSYKKYTLAWLGGTLGGLLFDIKWLYHSVAKNLWNKDRRLWRIFTPHLSGALAFIMIILFAADFFNVIDKDALENNPTALGIGFIVGYFSDNAIAKLTEVANTLFGATEKHSNSSK